MLGRVGTELTDPHVDIGTSFSNQKQYALLLTVTQREEKVLLAGGLQIGALKERIDETFRL
jgi:hypothetical protein